MKKNWHNNKTKIDNAQRNSKRRRYGDRDEMVNHQVSEHTKLAQKEIYDQTRLNGKGDPLGIVQGIKTCYSERQYIHKQEAI